MSTTVKTGWLNDKNGDKFAPKTLTSQIQTNDGILLEDKIQADIQAAKEDILEDISTEIGDIDGKISAHNASTTAHNDIRELVIGLTTRLNTLANSDDTTLDQMSEIVSYIKSNKSLIDNITTKKVNFSDIVDNLTTNVSSKPLSAAQGVALKASIDAINVPTKISDLNNDSGFITAVPAEYVTETELNSKGYLTEHQSLVGLASETYVDNQIADALGDIENALAEL